MLQEERNSLDGLARNIICGSIRNLATNLYTSSIHYLYEILQNFEDTRYKDKGTANIYVDRTCIIFSNNEIGFTVKDINSICGLSNSQKQFNTHIGNKGIGFKSVFLCTNNPIVVSKPSWKFQFHLNENDNLSFITPLNISDGENLPEKLESYMNGHKNLTTFIYLPFKDVYEDEYFERLLSSIDENILLFTKKIEKLVIEDKINNQTNAMSREITVEKENFYDNMTIKRVNLLKNNEVHKEFRVFQVNGADHSDVIAFPLNTQNNNKNKFSVFSVFPICDLKLNFLISSYWTLTTNRETVNEYDIHNLNLKSRLLETIFYIIKNDEIISQRLFDYLPKRDNELTSWWKSFILDFERKLKRFIDNKFPNFRICDELFDKLVERKEFELIKIKIIENNENLKDYIRNVSIIDLLLLLQAKTSFDYNDKWWELFFKLLLSNTEKSLAEILYNTSIFLIDSKRQPINNIDKCYLKNNDTKRDFVSICLNHNLSLIEYGSDNERIFLEEKLNLKKIDESLIFDTVLEDHKNEMVKNPKILMDDMEFIRNNLTAFEHYVKDKGEYCLCVPVKETLFALAENATLSTLFSIDFTTPMGIPLIKDKKIYKFIEYPTNNLKQCLEFEIFYLKLKCRLPEVNKNLLDEKIKLQENILMPSLNIFQSSLSISDAEIVLMNQLFELLPKDFIESIIYKLPVRLDNGNIVPIANMDLSTIRIEASRRDLAKKFGAKEVMHKSLLETFNEDDFQPIVLYPIDPEPYDPNRFEKIDKSKILHKPLINALHYEDDDDDDYSVKSLIKIYSERINQIQTIGLNERKIENRSTKGGNNILSNFDERINIGCRAELFFYLYLQQAFNDTLILEDCWVSSLRSHVFPDRCLKCDDTKGYDFEITDVKKVFSSDSSKKCLIEVKGFSTGWDGTFILTKNEIKRKDRVENNELYFIVIIEHVSSPDTIRIAEIINWTENDKIILKIEEESIKYKHMKQ